MEEKEEINDILNGNYITDSDVGFSSFYYKTVKRLLDIDNKANVSYLYRYAKIFHKYYDIFCQPKKGCRKDRHDPIIKLLKESFHYRLLYVYRNGTLLSSAVAFHFWNVYKKDPKSIKRLIKKKLVRLCSIGGCSITDIVAVISVLKSIALNNGIELDFRVTIIDSDTDWKNTCITVLSCLEEFRQATWKIDFIGNDLEKAKTRTTEVLKAIQEADVVTMVRFGGKQNVKRNIVKVLCNQLKTHAIILILDRPFAKFIKHCFGITDLFDFHLIHAELCDYHTLDIEAVKHFETLYEKHFRDDKYLKANVSLNLFVCVWMKASSEMCTEYRENLECIFQTNTEKYNPKQSFLSSNALTKWENLIRKKKEAAGWSGKNIKKFVQNQKGKRNNMFGKFIPLKKGVDYLQNHLLTQAESLDNEGKDFSETNENALENYLVQKRRYSLIKKNAYFSSLAANNLCSVIE